MPDLITPEQYLAQIGLQDYRTRVMPSATDLGLSEADQKFLADSSFIVFTPLTGSLLKKGWAAVKEGQATWSPEMRRYYNAVAKVYDLNYLKERPGFFETLAPFLVQELDKGNAKNVLVPGGGTGLYTGYCALDAQSRGLERTFLSIDQSEASNEQLENKIKRLGLRNVSIRTVDLSQLDESISGGYDFALFTNVLGHAFTYSFLEKVLPIMSPGARVLFADRWDVGFGDPEIEKKLASERYVEEADHVALVNHQKERVKLDDCKVLPVEFPRDPKGYLIIKTFQKP